MRIIAYTFEADFHCIACTHKRFCSSGVEIDEHGVYLHSIDRERNPVRPVFSTDELEYKEYCGDCHQPIN